jgi:glycosyltransferase involved in cell wall biosynthesis
VSAAARRDVALLTPVMPAEGGNGLAMRAGLTLEGLARSHDVRVIVAPVFGAPPPPGALVRRLATEVVVLPPDGGAHPAADLMERLARPASRERAQALHPRPALSAPLTLALARRVAEVVAGCAAVHVLRLYLAPLLDALIERRARPRLVIDVDDLESDVRRRAGAHEEADAFARLEAHYLPRVDLVLACSEADAARLRRLPGVAAAVLPNAVRLPRTVTPPGRRHDLLFVGNLGYAPNAAGVAWLAREVLPLLPGTRAAIVGASPGPDVRALAGPGLEVAADVPDLAPWYAGATVAVIPLHAGGGTRIKALEALAYARPVVATPIGVEGLAVGEAQGVLVADGAPDFAARCRALLDDPVRAEALGTAGRGWVRAHATVDAVAAALDRRLVDILAA